MLRIERYRAFFVMAYIQGESRSQTSLLPCQFPGHGLVLERLAHVYLHSAFTLDVWIGLFTAASPLAVT
ncbi:hypothetical protein E0H95_12390 [Pseudomonas syringae pv. tomato]|nr:hypothetical protein [Pseudomonas syringae pv. tomato]